MAVLVVTVGNVAPSDTMKSTIGLLGGTVTAGQAVRLSSGSWVTAQNNTAANAGESGLGIALTGGASGDYVWIAKPGSIITTGATMTAKETYFVSSTAGGLEQDSDLASTEYISPMIVALTTTTAYVLGVATGEQVS